MAAHIQNAIPEAIAIVVSDRDGTEPIFRITPEGMKILNACKEEQLSHHSHSAETMYKECNVNFIKKDVIVQDMRKETNNDHNIDDESMNESLPDIERIRRAENAARPRDSFDRSGFANVSFRKGVVLKGRPRKERGGAPTFKPTKPSKSTEAKLKKIFNSKSILKFSQLSSQI